ncbi:sarcosine oxidase subunit alpha family protein [Rhodospirillum sp. A1_3_36]|uniref:sarcosine oxidase subunit alpha family protein n=1 Tax=Rhodospirillum sp. A1_3_36 TaxID=3391666 RepID=UPI0039A5AD0E
MTRLSGGLIDRSRTWSFTFDGKTYQGHPGDTLASALLANGVRLVGRSFKYHRPRGVFSAGSEEPNALVELRGGAHREPNTRATVAELFDGLEAKSQNRWPSLAFDALAINDRVAPFLTAGFYYKTFMWPAAFWEKVYEPMIRRAAGLGSLSGLADPDVYDKGFLHCDLLVIGAGPAGLSAALTAARSGARVVLADEDFVLGGRLTKDRQVLDDAPAGEWVSATLAELEASDRVRILRRTSVIGAFDHGVHGAVERVTDHLATVDGAVPRQTFWKIYAKRSLLCAGAIERPMAFANNDRPGIMLAGAMRAYANRWAACPADRVAIFTNNDDGHRTAVDLMAKGVAVTAVVDVRPGAKALGDYPLHAGAVVIDSRGRRGLREARIRRADGGTEWLACGSLGVSGGWNPNLALTCHQGNRPVWDDGQGLFSPGPRLPPGLSVAGAAAGVFSTHGALTGGAEGAAKALGDLGFRAQAAATPTAEDAPLAITPFWHVGGEKGRAWVDFQNDVTVKDITLAHKEGFRSVEHLKRYTTLGMATDQGKTANVTGLAVMAELTGKSIPETGTTVFRPPYTPVAIGALAGRSRGKDFRPVRRTPSHHWAEEQGAAFVEVGAWLRAQYFPRPGEKTWRDTVDREVLTVRRAVGVCDVTTLGKVDVQGRDAARFLDVIYCNGFAKLPLGKVRYGLMLREDGFAMDDGTAARLAEDHFVVTTTTAQAGPVYRHMEFVRQCLCPELDVHLISTTDAWAQYSVAGPRARDLLRKIVDPEFDISNEAFGYMACGAIRICGGTRARLFRISFSGELAYEVAVPTRHGDALMRVLMEAGAEFGVIAYGTEALGVLRIEKGHAAGNELNGQTSADHLGMGRLVSSKKDAIGTVLSRRPGLAGEDGIRLVGLESLDGPLTAGSHLFTEGDRAEATNDQGWVSSAAHSPHLGKSIALAFLKEGDKRLGDVITVANPLQGQSVRAKVVGPHFIDPEGERLRV